MKGNRLRTLSQGQRVNVVAALAAHDGASEIVINALGTVERMRTDGGAFVTLDKRSVDGVHSFDKDDGRAKNVLTYPDLCEPATEGKAAGTRAERRRNKKIASDPTSVTVDKFGKDHWSTFGYLASIAIDGEPAREKMRCDLKRHPFLIHPLVAQDCDPNADYPTRLKGGEMLHNHDDWDCMNDLEAAGLVTNVGTAVNPRVRLTPLGSDVMRQLAEYKQGGGNFATFAPRIDDQGAA